MTQRAEEAEHKLSVAELALGFPVVAQHVRRYEDVSRECEFLRMQLAAAEARAAEAEARERKLREECYQSKITLINAFSAFLEQTRREVFNGWDKALAPEVPDAQ